MLRLYDNHLSRNGYKIRLLLSHLGRAFEYVEVDITTGQSRVPAFLAKNPAGRIPVLELDDGTLLPESGAILWHLAEGTALLPADTLDRAQTLRWMFFEQNLLEPNIGGVKMWAATGRDKAQPEAFAVKMASARDGLAALDRHLTTHDWLAAGRLTIADIATYGYVSESEHAGIPLAEFPAVAAWLARVAAQPRHVSHDWIGAGADSAA
ncbi:glutathione S-transferase family protein [Novispirillum sp. DQ9]|uniref:glutathione S-transferase family protein n=1 Tax=Novispirillum sp. DQ9 TaxID=3398612 RepID=UPI003C7AF75E